MRSEKTRRTTKCVDCGDVIPRGEWAVRYPEGWLCEACAEFAEEAEACARAMIAFHGEEIQWQ